MKTFLRTDRTLYPSPKEWRFLELIEGYEIKKVEGKYPDLILYYKKNKCLFGFKNLILWVDFYNFWSFIKNEFNMDFYDNRSFIVEMAEKHFKLWDKNTTFKWVVLLDSVEKHFKIIK